VPGPSPSGNGRRKNYGLRQILACRFDGAAIDLAIEGFRVEDDLADSLPRARERLARWPSTRVFFSRTRRAAGGRRRLIQFDLADTLQSIARRRSARLLPGPYRWQDRRRRAKGRRHHDQGDLSITAIERPVVRGTIVATISSSMRRPLRRRAT